MAAPVETPSDDIVRRVERLLGSRALWWGRVWGGYTPADRWRVHTIAGSAFIKIGTDELTGKLLRREAFAYGRVCGEFLPEFYGFEDNPLAPILAIADLSSAWWPPPWRGGDVRLVMTAASRMHATRSDPPRFADVHGHWSPGWCDIAVDPEPFLSLGIVTAEW